MRLTAWTEGRASDSLKQGQPPIEASDHQWSQGMPLVKYEITKNDYAAGADQAFGVILWLEDRPGKPRKEAAKYFVGTSPALSVSRSGM